MKTHQPVAVRPEEIPDRIHKAIEQKDFQTVLNIIKPIRRKADFWDLADKFHRTYGYNFRFEIRRNGSAEHNVVLADFENSLNRVY